MITRTDLATADETLNMLSPKWFRSLCLAALRADTGAPCSFGWYLRKLSFIASVLASCYLHLLASVVKPFPPSSPEYRRLTIPTPPGRMLSRSGDSGCTRGQMKVLYFLLLVDLEVPPILILCSVAYSATLDTSASYLQADGSWYLTLPRGLPRLSIDASIISSVMLRRCTR